MLFQHLFVSAELFSRFPRESLPGRQETCLVFYGVARELRTRELPPEPGHSRAVFSARKVGWPQGLSHSFSSLLLSKSLKRFTGALEISFSRVSVLQLHGEKPLPTPNGCSRRARCPRGLCPPCQGSSAGMHGASVSSSPVPPVPWLLAPRAGFRSGSRSSSIRSSSCGIPPWPYGYCETRPLCGQTLYRVGLGHTGGRKKDIIFHFIVHPDVLSSSLSLAFPGVV